jgi:hypothetical protein
MVLTYHLLAPGSLPSEEWERAATKPPWQPWGLSPVLIVIFTDHIAMLVSRYPNKLDAKTIKNTCCGCFWFVVGHPDLCSRTLIQPFPALQAGHKIWRCSVPVEQCHF